MTELFQNKTSSLTALEKSILLDAAEPPHSGVYASHQQQGSYLCRQCGIALFRSDSKFLSACGWPSFDDEILQTVEKKLDPDGSRIEIHCQRCKGHLGHIFENEGFTSKNKRYCVNSLSIDFSDSLRVNDTREIIVAGGCFWGLEHHLAKEDGVVFSQVGYIGGNIPDPSYQEVCSGETSYYEAVRLIFDSEKTDEKKLYQAFFEWHDPTDSGGQGPDRGSQYLSAIFVYEDHQRQIALGLVEELCKKGLKCTTEVKAMSPFYKAEEEHQSYLLKNPTGYCSHIREKRF